MGRCPGRPAAFEKSLSPPLFFLGDLCTINVELMGTISELAMDLGGT